MTESEIIDGLLARDEAVTRAFFFGDGTDSCKGMLVNVLKAVYSRPVTSGRFSVNAKHVVYEDAAAAFYAHLMSQDARRLRDYDRSRNRLYGYLRTCAVFFFTDEQEREARRDGTWKEKGSDDPADAVPTEHIITVRRRTPEAAEAPHDDGRDLVETALAMLPSPRGREVLQRVWLDGEEAAAVAADLGITLNNLYNIRSRTWREYVRIAAALLKEGDIKAYG